jgi:hypothetical protein
VRSAKGDEAPALGCLNPTVRKPFSSKRRYAMPIEKLAGVEPLWQELTSGTPHRHPRRRSSSVDGRGKRNDVIAEKLFPVTR